MRRLAGLNPEIPAGERVASVDLDHEVGDAVAVGVAGDVGGAADLLVAQLAGGVVECGRADERERLVAADEGVGVDRAQIDLVLA